MLLPLLLILSLSSSKLEVVSAVRTTIGNVQPEHSLHNQLHDGRDTSTEFSNEWLVHLDGTAEAADLLALKLGYDNLGEVHM